MILLPGFALDESEENRSAISYLKGLQIEDLINVEVVLDDVFDVFDGLIKARKTTIATGETQSVSRAPSVTTVITAQDIEASGARGLDDVLEAVPGLHIVRNTLGYRPTYAMRGMLSLVNPEVLMMINGIPFKAEFSGNRGFAWPGMSVNAISRIEVIRGPGSAVYGADAFAGVINIVTKNSEDIKGTEAGVRTGSFNTQEGWVSHGDEWAGFKTAVTLQYQTTDGQDKTIEADAQTLLDKTFGTHASLAPGPVNLRKNNLEARLDISRGHWQLRAGYLGGRDLGTGAGIAQALDPRGHVDITHINSDLTYHNPNLTPTWDVAAQLSVVNMAIKDQPDNRLYPPGAYGGKYPDGFIGNPGVSERNSRLDVYGFYSGWRKHLFRIGAGYHYGDVYKTTESKNFGINPATGLPLSSPTIVETTDTKFIFAYERPRDDYYLSLQDIWDLAPTWELTAGVRYDYYSDFGETVNPRLALVWQSRPTLTSKLLYGSAFRAPSFEDLYNQNNPVALGNPNVKPEMVDTWELAFDYRATENAHLALNLFKYKVTDKIQLVLVPGGTSKMAQNAGSLDGQGLEVEARWKMTKRSSLLVNYAFQEVTEETDHNLGFTPQHSAYLRTDWLVMPNWFLDTQVRWIAERQRSFIDERPPIDDYTTVDLTLRYKDIKQGHWNFAAGIRNLFDADAREPSFPSASGAVNIPNDFPLAGRNYFLELRYHF